MQMLMRVNISILPTCAMFYSSYLGNGSKKMNTISFYCNNTYVIAGC